jgi:hypothetical protein
MEEELEDIPDDADADADADGDLVDPDADATDAAAADIAAADADADADAPAEPAKSDEELAAERAVVVAAVEADIEKRKQRAERFGLPFELTDADKTRLECAKTGKPISGSKVGLARLRMDQKTKKQQKDDFHLTPQPGPIVFSTLVYRRKKCYKTSIMKNVNR